MMLFKLLKGSDANQYQSIVISLLDKSTMGEAFEKINKPVITLQWSKWYRLLVAPVSIVALLIKYRPDIIQGWMYHGNLVASMMGFFYRKSSVAWNIRHTVYDLNEENPRLRFLIKLGAKISTRTKAMIFNSRVSQHKHAEIGYSNVNNMVIANGFDVNQFKPAENKNHLRKTYKLPEHFTVIGHVARYHPMKDHAGFVNACVAMANKHENICFVLVGRDINEPHSKLSEQIEHSGCKHLFYRLGEQGDMVNIYNLFDIFVISSAWGEAFPNVLGEAMACAVPAVVTNVGDAAEIAGETGLVVPPKNTPALAQAMDTMLQMSVIRRQALGQQARQRIIENFELSTIVNKYEHLYATLVNVQA